MQHFLWEANRPLCRIVSSSVTAFLDSQFGCAAENISMTEKKRWQSFLFGRCCPRDDYSPDSARQLWTIRNGTQGQDGALGCVWLSAVMWSWSSVSVLRHCISGSATFMAVTALYCEWLRNLRSAGSLTDIHIAVALTCAVLPSAEPLAEAMNQMSRFPSSFTWR